MHDEQVYPMAVSEKSQVSIRIPTPILADLERIAQALDRDRSWVMLQAFRSYLTGDGGQILSEIEGLEKLDAGQSADFDAVLDEADMIIDAARRRGRLKAG